jgi:PHD/YefM family antitoxin component YafN of YafNO toxin-antitoxin module
MSNQLRRIIKLAKKTGDRVVVFDNSEPEESFVVMGLDEYEEMLGLGEQPEPAEPSSYQQITNKSALTEEKIADRMDGSDKMWKEDKNFHKENIYSSGQVLKNRFKNNNWQIPNSIKKAAEEVEEQE